MKKYQETEWIPSSATLPELLLGGILLFAFVTGTLVGMLLAFAGVVVLIITHFSKESRDERRIKNERRSRLAYAQCILWKTNEPPLRSGAVESSSYSESWNRTKSFCWFDSFEEYRKKSAEAHNMLSYIPSSKIDGAYWVKLWNDKSGLFDSNGKLIGLISREWDRRLKIREPVIADFNGALFSQ